MKSKVQKSRETKNTYKPTKSEQDLISLIEKEWHNAYLLKTRTWRQLRGLNIDTFMSRLRDHYNGHVDPLADNSSDWRSRIFKRKSRHKVLSVVASFVSSGLGVEISAHDIEQRMDRAMSSATEDIYDWSLDRENFEYTFLKFLLELVITGTAHTMEEIVWKEREVKEIMDIDFETGKIDTKKVTRTIFKGCKSSFVSNSEIFIGDAWQHDIQDQPYVFRRQTTTFESASETLGRYKNWKYVVAGSDNFFHGSEDGEKNDSDDQDENDVEILYRWNKQEDEYSILCNKILLTDVDNCIPYPHKNYPLVKTVFETFADGRFYWGDSLVNKNYDEQEMVNKLINLFIDAQMLAKMPPLITTNAEIAGNDIIVPGVQVTMEAEDDFRTIEAATRGINNTDFNLLQSVETGIDLNSIDPLLSGQSPAGDPTATEVRAIVGSAERVKELNEQFVSHALVQMANLRVPNLLWFVTHDDEYRKIVIDKVKTSTSGKTGKRIIKFVDAIDMPNADLVFQASGILDKEEEPTDFVFIDKESVNDYRFHVRIAVIRKPSRSQATRVSRVVTKYRLYATNPMVDQRENTKMLMEALGDDYDRLLSAQTQTSETPQVELPAQSAQMDKALTDNQSSPQML